MNQQEDLRDKLFTYLEAACLAEGGDGDSALLHPDYKDVVEKFDDWLKLKNNTWWSKSISEGYIMYYHDQESIMFTDKREMLSPCVITVIETCFIL